MSDKQTMLRQSIMTSSFRDRESAERAYNAIAGPLAGALAGGAAGATAGGLVGMLVGAGIPEERARVYETDLKEGGIVLGVMPRHDDDARHFDTEWRTQNAHR